MPEINPLTNNQIFLKKIAENTGSNYETGDVSEINPLTIDQIFLKEIAANTAGQSGDISELEGKVADNTAAIEAIVDVNGACNLCPVSATTKTHHGITFTVNSDGSITASGTADSGSFATIDIMLKTDLPYGTYKGSGGVNEHCRIMYGLSNSSGTLIRTVDDSGEGIELTVDASTPKVSMALIIDAGTDLTTPVTFYPMLYDARLNPTGYVSPAMTNKELTDRLTVKSVTVTPESGILLSFNRLRVANNMLYGDVALFNQVSDLPTRTWVTIATCDLRPSYDIQTALFSSAEGISGGLMIITQSGDIQVFQSYYDPVGGVTKKGAAGVFSHPL